MCEGLALMRMKLHHRSVGYGIGIGGVAVVVLVVLLLLINRENRSEEPVDATPSQSAEPFETPSPGAELPDAAEPSGWVSAYASFDTNGEEAIVLWRSGASRLEVQRNRLRYIASDGDEQTLHEWTGLAGREAQAWANGAYMLIGAEADEGGNGEWLTVRVEPAVELLHRDISHLRPELLLAVAAAQQQGVFVLQFGNENFYSEYLIDPARPGRYWITIEVVQLGPGPTSGKLPRQAGTIESLVEVPIGILQDGNPVHAYRDGAGTIVYDLRAVNAIRFADYELDDVKPVAYLNENAGLESRLLGSFRGQTGDEAVSLMDHGGRKLPTSIWEGGWGLMESDSSVVFIRIAQDRVEAVDFSYWGTDEERSPRHHAIPIQEGEQVTVKGDVLQFEKAGTIRTLSWRDLINSDTVDSSSLLAAPLTNFTVMQDDWPEIVYEKARVLEGTIRLGDTEHSAIPSDLYEALRDQYYGSDYAMMIAAHQDKADWFAIVDHRLVAYKQGQWQQIGELPIATSVYTEEAFFGSGALDFMRIDGGWIVADTQASRVIKLNDKLEVEAELAVPSPYRLTQDGDRLRIDAIAKRYYTDMDLRLAEVLPQPFESTAGRKMTNEGYMANGWYEDKQTGLIWYLDFGTLYQVNEKRGEYRSFYIGNLENGWGKARIIPRGNEVLVMLDRRLERFDRQGNWIATLNFPRVEPDGIYATSPQGEGSLFIDEESGDLYLVQGYRVLRIDVAGGEVESVFRQNYADIGNLVPDGDKISFILRSDREGAYRNRHFNGIYTEIVQLDRKTHAVSRYYVEGYYDELEVKDSGYILHVYE